MLTARDHRIETVNAELDRALDRRVELHQARAAGTIEVREYLHGLREVRTVERRLEAVRRAAGCTVSRAVELCAAEGHEAAAQLVTEREADQHPTPPEPAAALLQSLSDTTREELRAGQRPRCAAEGAGGGGPFRAAIKWTSKGVQVDAYSASEWASEVAWHTYWGPRDYDTLNPELAAAAPPSPRSPRRSVSFTIAEVRRLVRDSDRAQLPLDEQKQLSSRKSDWRCVKCGGTNDVAGWPRTCVECTPPQIWTPGKPRPARAAPRLYDGAPPRGWKGKVRALVAKRPGITIPEIAAEVEIPHRHLYRWLPESELVKRGRGWYPDESAAPQPAPRPACAAAAPPPLVAQLDLDGVPHEIAPHTRQEQLFTPAPTQLAGQTHMDTDNESEEA